MASRESLNMGSRSSNIISDLKSGIAGMRQEVSLLKQETSGWIQSLGAGVSRLGGFGGGIGGGGISTTLVAPNPTFNAPAIQPASEGNVNQIAAGPSSSIVPSGFGSRSGTDLTTYVQQHAGSGNLYSPSLDAASGGAGWGGGGAGGSGGGSANGGWNYGGGNNPSSYNNQFNNSGGTFANNFFQNLKGNAFATFQSNPVGSALFAANLAGNFLPSTSDIVQSNLSLQRASFFSGKDYATMQQQNTLVSKGATLGGSNPAMDVMNAMLAAQSYGLAGAQNFNAVAGANGQLGGVLGGVANLSNLVPGAGVEGTMRAFGAMQQGYSVNMLKGIGIQLRDANGNMTPPDKVIDDIWKKICRDYSQAYGANKSPTLQMVQVGLQPGNSLDSMLNTYFGGDPILKQMVANGLIYKATTGGGAITQEGVKAAGGTTGAVLSYTARNAASANLLSAVSQDTAGFTSANTAITFLTNSLGTTLANSITLFMKQFTDTILAAANGAPGDILTTLGALSARAAGGPVDKSKPYLVGELGPEVFVPTSNGVIVNNDQLKKATENTPGSGGVSSNTYNFTVNVPNANTPEVIAAIKNLITEMETNKRVSES